jgi:hypothetical protein
MQEANAQQYASTRGNGTASIRLLGEGGGDGDPTGAEGVQRQGRALGQQGTAEKFEARCAAFEFLLMG